MRGVIGTYHHMSEAHLGRYCTEFDLGYNSRDFTMRNVPEKLSLAASVTA